MPLLFSPLVILFSTCYTQFPNAKFEILILILALVIFIMVIKAVLLNDPIMLRRIFWGHIFCLSLPIAVYYFCFERQGDLYDVSVFLWLLIVNIILFRALLDAKTKERKEQ